jgi:hypothetical protein
MPRLLSQSSQWDAHKPVWAEGTLVTYVWAEGTLVTYVTY